MSELKDVFMTMHFAKENIPNFDGIVKNFESRGYKLTIGPSYRKAKPEELIDILKGRYACVIGGEIMTREVLSHCRHLKVISRMGAGWDDIDLEAATEFGIPVTVTKGANSPAVAEHAMAMMMALTRKVALLDKQTRQGVWKPLFGTSVYRKTLGIIGLGAIGKLLAQYVSGFDMKILAYDPMQDEKFAKEHNVQYVPLETLIRESDFISLHCPILEGNKYILSTNEFDMMKKGVQIINCARGMLIDEKALHQALLDGRVAGAALDVWEQEPVNMDNPLLKMDNVVVSSHTAGMTFEVRGRVIEHAFENIMDVTDGKMPFGILNPETLKK